MTILFKFILTGLSFAFVWTATLGATSGPRTRIERTLTREFKTSGTPEIRMNTQKGQIKFQTWSENRVLIKITVTSEADSKNQAEDGLDMVDIITQKSDDMVHIETDFHGTEDSFWSLIKFWEGNLKIMVDMVINVPVNSVYNLTHQYGDLILPNIRGGQIDIKYASLNCGHVREDLNLSAAYSKGTIGDLNYGNVLLQYSDFNFGNTSKCDAQVAYSKFRSVNSDIITMDSKYSSIKAGKVKVFKSQGKFDKIEIEDAGDVRIHTKYTAIDIGKVSSNVEISNSYQSTKVRNILPGFRSIHISGSYGNCLLGLADSLQAEFILETKYGNIRLPDNARILSRDESDSSRIIKGQFGQGGQDIFVMTSYGNITLEKN